MIRIVPRCLSFARGRVPKRLFSEEIKQATKSLSQAIKAELDHEEEELKNNQQVPDQEFLSQKGWKQRLTNDSTRIELSRSTGDTEVQVVFDARMNESNPPEEEQGEQAEQEEEDGGVDFLVFLSKGQGRRLVADCIAQNGRIDVTNIACLDEKTAKDLFQDKSVLFTRSHYTGPSFDSLDERLQEKIVSYLASVGVNEELATYVEQKAYDHEAELYRGWLKSFHEVLN